MSVHCIWAKDEMQSGSQRSEVVTRRCKRRAASRGALAGTSKEVCDLRHEVRRWGADEVLQSNGREERVRRRWRRGRGRWTGGGGGEEAEGEGHGAVQRMKESVNYATHTHAARAFALLVLLMARQGRESGRIVPSRLVTSRFTLRPDRPTPTPGGASALEPPSLLPAARLGLEPGGLEICTAAGLEVGLPLSLVSRLTAIRNTTIINNNNITHPHPHAHAYRL